MFTTTLLTFLICFSIHFAVGVAPRSRGDVAAGGVTDEGFPMAGFNIPTEDPNLSRDRAERSMFNGWESAGQQMYGTQATQIGVGDGGGGQSMLMSQPTVSKPSADDLLTTPQFPMIHGNDEVLVPPLAPEDPIQPPKFDPLDFPDTNYPEIERWYNTPGIKDPLKVDPPVPRHPQITRVFPHAACMHGGCRITIWGTDLYVESVEFDKTQVIVGGVPCTDVVAEEVLSDCRIANAEGSQDGASETSLDKTSDVFVEIDAFSKIVPPSLLELRRKQRRMLKQMYKRQSQGTDVDPLYSRRDLESYSGNRVVSPFIPPGRERIEFQKRARDQFGDFVEPTQRIDVLSPIISPTSAYNDFGGNFPIAVPNNWQYPPFTAKPPVLPITAEEEKSESDVFHDKAKAPKNVPEDNKNINDGPTIEEKEAEAPPEARSDCSSAEVHGDSTISDMLSHPQKYRVRATILVWVLRMAYRAAIYNNPSVRIVVMTREKSPATLNGIVKVETFKNPCPDKIPILGQVPGYSSMYAGEAVESLRYHNTRLLAESSDLNAEGVNRAIRSAKRLSKIREERTLAMYEATHDLNIVDVILSKT